MPAFYHGRMKNPAGLAGFNIELFVTDV